MNSALSELMALDFAVDELGLYLTTHADDKEALELYWSYIALAQEGRKRYQETYGPSAANRYNARRATAGSMIRGPGMKEEIADVCI